MNEITLENYRCFRERQSARLAPLTLLVGENSTGKTSFLALIRALTDLAYRNRIPDFKEDPYDLGSFDEIAHIRSGRGDRAKRFEAGLTIWPKREKGPSTSFSFAFEERRTAPVPTRRRLSSGKDWIDNCFATDSSNVIRVGTRRGAWKFRFPEETDPPLLAEGEMMLPFHFFFLAESLREAERYGVDITSVQGSPTISDEDIKRLTQLSYTQLGFRRQRLFASAPVRSKPRRTYDPSRPTRDPEGDYVPMFLADVFSRDKRAWTKLKERLEQFGSMSGLFDEISIKRLGKRGSEPFQVQIRKFGGRRKGPQHNLIDVGYGVSQALPVIAELLRQDAPNQFLLQQPEVHFHPRAQAALGSLFCQIASPDRQLVVETHSDYLLDRVRMEVRDGTAGLKPEDVSILFFERTDLDVHIHSLEIDKLGNIVNAPDSYGNFFMDETARLLRL